MRHLHVAIKLDSCSQIHTCSIAYAAGHHYNENTGCAEFLCLPHDVQWTQHGRLYSLDGGLYGTEYGLHIGMGEINQDALCCVLSDKPS